MTSALDLFMKGMISSKSRECGAFVDCVLIVDNAVPDSESYYDGDASRNSLASVSACSLDTVGTADMTTATSAAVEEDHNSLLDCTEDHLRILRWSASMGDRVALVELKAVEEKLAERDTIEYQKKLRWRASMGDTTSISRPKSTKRNSRWSAGCEKEERKDVTSKKMNLMKPMRRSSFRLPKLSLL